MRGNSAPRFTRQRPHCARRSNAQSLASAHLRCPPRAVIPRASGVSSTPRPFGLITNVSEYGLPAFAGDDSWGDDGLTHRNPLRLDSISNMRGNSSISAINSASRIGSPATSDLAGAYGFRKICSLGDHLVERTALEREAGVGVFRLRSFRIGQRAVFEGQRKALSGVGELPVQHEVPPSAFGPLTSYPEHVPQLFGAQRRQGLARHWRPPRCFGHAQPHLCAPNR